jgi:hypothetical protein
LVHADGWGSGGIDGEGMPHCERYWKRRSRSKIDLMAAIETLDCSSNLDRRSLTFFAFVGYDKVNYCNYYDRCA